MALFAPPTRNKGVHVMDNTDEFVRDAIQWEVLSFYERGELPTLDLVLKKVKEYTLSFQGERTSLWWLLRNLGFKCKKHSNSRVILMERIDDVAARNKYLRKMAMNRKCNDPDQIYFLTKPRCWATLVEQGRHNRAKKERKGCKVHHSSCWRRSKLYPRCIALVQVEK